MKPVKRKTTTGAKKKPARATRRPRRPEAVASQPPVDPNEWRRVWRDGFAPVMGTCALEALRAALDRDDQRLMQGATVDPVPYPMSGGAAPCKACAIGIAGWLGEWLLTADQVEEYFATVCFNADQRIGESSSCRHFLNWVDDTPRAVMRRQLLAEVDLALAGRVRIQPSETVNPAA